MRDANDPVRAAYAGRSPQEVADIAAGRLAPNNGYGKEPLPPIRLESMKNGQNTIVDGRHRYRAAKEAGAPEIAATMDGRPTTVKLNAQPGQLELPAVPSPEYNYHATPQSNAQKIAELGLRPEEGGKNFAFQKNKGRVYMSPEKDAEMWASKLKDLSGEEPLQIRTTAPAQNVPGANEAVRIRTDAVAPERLQYKAASGWEPLKRLLEKKQGGPLPPNMSEHQLKLLAAALGVKWGLDEASN